MKKISFYCSKKATDNLKKRIEGYPDTCLRLVKIENHPKYNEVSEFTVKYYDPHILISLGEEKNLAEMDIE